MKTLKLFGKIMAITITIMVIIFVFLFIYINWGKSEVLKTKINGIKLNDVNDGKYIGSFDGYRWSNTVEVTVADKKITSIRFIEGQRIRVKELEDKIVNEVIKEQTTKVDTVAGGTISSKAMLKAIENAFRK